MKDRIVYLDAVKGFAIILVVMGHVIQYSFQSTSFLYHSIYSFHMPLFFFVSGLLSKKWDLVPKDSFFSETFKFILSKVRSLIIPLVVVGSLFIIYMGQTFQWFWFNQYKGGYWFLFTLFECQIVLLFFAIISNLINKKKRIWIDVSFISIILLALKVISVLKLIPTDIDNLLGFGIFNHHVLFMFFGLILVKYNFVIHFLTSNVLYAFVFIAFVVNIFLFNKLNFNIPYYWDLFQGLCGAVLFTAFFYRLSDNFKFKNQLVSLGKRSLEIYIFHYFFIFSFILPQIGAFLRSNNSGVLELTLVVFFSISIIFISLSVGTIISQGNYLRFIILGKKDKIV